MAAQDARSVTEALHLEGVEDPKSVTQARTLLDGLKITNPARDRISIEKQARVHDALLEAYFLYCPTPACVTRMQQSGRDGLLVRKDRCSVCGGSNARRAVEDMIKACAAAGIHKVCVVGGSPALREELDAMAGNALRLTLVDGTQTPDVDRARTHVRNHDVVVICGSSQLNHKLSGNYGAFKAEGHVITSARRGLESIAEVLTFHAHQRVSGKT